MHSEEAPHRVWASWNHPASKVLSEYLIGSKMLEDDTAQYHHMAFIIPHETLPPDFLSFIAAINDIFYFLESRDLGYLFDPSDKEAEKLSVLPLDFQIPKLDYPNFTKALTRVAPTFTSKAHFYPAQAPSGCGQQCGPCYRVYSAVRTAAKTAPRETLLEAMVKAEPDAPEGRSFQQRRGRRSPCARPLVGYARGTAYTQPRIIPPPSPDVPLGPRRAVKRKASNESVASANARLPVSPSKKKGKGVARERAKKRGHRLRRLRRRARGAPETKPKAAAKSNIVVVPRRRNHLADQVLHYLNERVKKGAPRASKVDLDFHDLDGNLPWDRPERVPLGLCIRSTPMHFYSHLTPTSGARKTTEGYKSHFSGIPKIPSTIVEEVDFSEAGIPESACIQCILLGSECTPIAFGMSCSQCQQRKPGAASTRARWSSSILLRDLREVRQDLGVTEMLLKNLQDGHHHRTAGLAKLYAESSEELIDVFKHVSSHIEQVIDYAPRGAPPQLNRRVSDDAEERCLDTIPAEKIPEDSRLITTDFAALGVAFANEGPSTPSPKATRSILAKSTLPKEGDSAAGPRSLTDIHHSPDDQEDVDMLQDDVAGTSQPA
ncbi:hypothetical protein B0H14DRAFT_3523004 [Mycena olivaceomarginata]|nr:hypothetical protein B0H14DRAFT_3523004 [Mycena olivaceomarginata]